MMHWIIVFIIVIVVFYFTGGAFNKMFNSKVTDVDSSGTRQSVVAANTYCTNCGEVIGNDVKFCGVCGHKVEEMFLTGLKKPTIDLKKFNIPEFKLDKKILVVAGIIGFFILVVSAIPSKVYKADNMIIAMKNLSNPFEVKDKIVGKRIETQMFVEKFVDEGNKARVIDANTGFFCRMDGREYGKHNKRGVIVVVGTLVSESGSIGLNDCEFVSYDSDWRPTNSYEELIK
jgi:uncharacterized membrane protein YvbJ